MNTSRIDIRLTEEEKRIIESKAKQYSMSTSDYIRFIALNAEIKATVANDPTHDQLTRAVKAIKSGNTELVEENGITYWREKER